MAVPEDRRSNRRTSRNRDYLDDDDDRERVRGIGGGYGGRGWEEEYGGRRSDRYGPGQQPGDDDAGWRRDRERARGWYGTRDDDNDMPSGGSIPRGRAYAGRRGSESMAGTPGALGRASMAGKGPKGYVRSDERIREDVCDRLTDDPSLDASSIEVKVRNGEVTLSGTVDSRQARRHAEDLAEVSGVKHLQNNLRVQEAEPDIDVGPTS